MNTNLSKQDNAPKKLCNEDLEKELQNAKLVFGDKLIDPHDRRIRKPHSRVVGPFAGNSTKNTDNAGGLLKTNDHRPTTDK